MGAEYRLTANPNMVVHVPTGRWIPLRAGNPFYEAYQKWLADGNVPDTLPTEEQAVESERSKPVGKPEKETEEKPSGANLAADGEEDWKLADVNDESDGELEDDEYGFFD